jgi:hypothetical protein
MIWYQHSLQPKVGCSPIQKIQTIDGEIEAIKRNEELTTHFVISISTLITEPALQPKDGFRNK